MKLDLRIPFSMLLAVGLAATTAHAAAADVPALIPMPASLTMDAGNFHPGKTLHVSVEGRLGDRRAITALASDVLREAWHRPVGRATTHAPADLRLVLAPAAGSDPESYTLQVTKRGIVIRAANDAGLFYGLQTLRQIATPDSDARAGIPALHIADQPRFRYRGLMLDSARHMQPLAAIKQQLDVMARYKFNTFHWHISDDQGWRLEIKRYPKLATISSMRKETLVGNANQGAKVRDGIPYGGYYTQAQAREIVAYARARYIEVIPEIDMPGHMVAALAAYPELACTPGPFEVMTTWGVADDILCPSEQTFQFVEGVLTEVMEVFPSAVIHVGGDEAPITRWKQSALAQDIIKREGLKDEHALQGWFLRRIEAFVRAHGRRIIGWDEILEGGASQTATVMSWRGMQGGIEAARLGHDVVMSPTSYVYLDYCQSRSPDEPRCIGGNLPLHKVYDFEPVPDGLSAEQAAHIIGGQGNLWTEYLKTPQTQQYMLFPRSLALAEVLWSPKGARDWNGFVQRLPAQLAELDRLHVSYRIPEVQGLDGDRASLDPHLMLPLGSLLPDARIVYTLDGSAPDAASPRYETPLQLTLGDTPVQVAARLLLPDGRLGPTQRARFSFTTLHAARPAPAAALAPGLQRDYYEVGVARTDALLAATPKRSDVADAIAIPADARAEQFGLRYRGYADVPDDGIYHFVLASDDGARVYIDDALVVDRDGPQSPGTTSGDIGLARGLHTFELRYFQGGGDRELRLQVGREGQQAAAIPAAWWRH
ncbi:family 20 glycosylhydrolase [Solilutibacter silvestris]|uniref:beta-N-acetylhexosaminidase n=1 Tax=Solilutibacter silvestris TaxID=1645665 RepID=A0A2K1Q0Y7_9GAMM|nr:family 20 glycosylhydrolase [Lysobacter silvestris]PNS08708.1 N-acetyl-beta-hexosaminidase [Lysobacter silvestris]